MLLTGDWRRRWRFVLALLAAATAVAGGEPVRLSVTAPLGLRVRPGGVAPVAVDLETAGPLDATLALTSSGPGGMQVAQPVKVGEGHFRYEVPYPVPLNAAGTMVVQVALTAGSRDVVLAQVLRFDILLENPMAPHVVVGWVAARGAPDDRDLVEPVKPGGEPLEEPAAPPAARRLLPSRNLFGGLGVGGRSEPPVPEMTHWAFNRLGPAKMPADWRLFIGYDLIAVAAGGGAKLTAAQVAALDQWVHAGGRLLLGTDSLPPGYDQAPFAKAFAPPSAAAGAGVGRESRGLGDIHRTDLRLDQAIAGKRGAAPEVLTRTGLQTLGRRPWEENPWAGYSASYNAWHYGQEYWAPALERWLALERLSYRAILLFAALFLLVAGVLEPLVLKRLRRAHWTWVVTPLVVLAFCAAAFEVQRVSRGYRSRVASIAMHDYGLGRGGVHRTVTCLIPATGRARQLQAPGRAALFTRYVPENDAARATVGAKSSGATMSAPAWSPVFLGTLAAHDEAPPLAAELTLVGDQLRGTVTATRPELGPTWLLVSRGAGGWVGRFATGTNGLAVSDWERTAGWKALREYFAREPYLWPAHSSEDDGVLRSLGFGRRAWRSGWYDADPNRDELARVIADLARLEAPAVGGLHQTLSAEADASVWLLAVCERGPELEVAGPVKRQQVHLVRQRVRLQGGEASTGVPR